MFCNGEHIMRLIGLKKLVKDIKDAYIEVSHDTEIVTYGNIADKIANMSTGGESVLTVNATFESGGIATLDKTYNEITETLLAEKLVIIKNALYGTFVPVKLLQDQSVRFETTWNEENVTSIVGIVIHPDNTANWDLKQLSTGGVEYSSIVYNEDNTITLTEKDGTIHTMVCTYENGKLIGVTYDGEAIDLTYADDLLLSVGGTSVDVNNAPTKCI